MSGFWGFSNRVLVIIHALLETHQHVVAGDFLFNNQTSRTSASTTELVELARLNDFASPVRGALAGTHLSIAIYAADFGRWLNYTGGWELYNQSIHLPPRAFRGFIPQMIDEIAKEVGCTYDFFPVWMSSESDAFDPAVLLTSGEVNVTLNYGLHPSDFGVNKLFGRYLFTPPIYDTSVSALVLKTICRTTFWRFMDPFTPDLWASLGAGLVVSAVLMVGIEHLNTLQPASARRSAMEGAPPSQRAPPTGAGGVLAQAVGVEERAPSEGKGARFGRALYHATALYLQGDDREWLTVPERILRLSLLFVVLIMVASYTANLAAFFTLPNYTLHGPKSVPELRNAVACTANFPDEDDGSSVLRPYVKELISVATHSDEECSGYWQDCATKFCHDAVKDGRADVWLDDRNALHVFMLDHGCRDLAEVPGISILPGSSNFKFITKATDIDVSIALAAGALQLTRQPLYQDICSSIFRPDLTCNDEYYLLNDTTPISFSNMLGLFCLWAVLAFAAVIVASGQAIVRTRIKADRGEGCATAHMQQEYVVTTASGPSVAMPHYQQTNKVVEVYDSVDEDVDYLGEKGALVREDIDDVKVLAHNIHA